MFFAYLKNAIDTGKKILILDTYSIYHFYFYRPPFLNPGYAY